MFRTRLPVASKCIATLLLPLDLHVLSLPLAFILSQDQTLHCKCCLILTLLTFEINVVFLEFVTLNLPVLICIKTLLLLPIFQRTYFVFRNPFFERECKGREFLNSINFFLIFFQNFEAKELHYYTDFELIKALFFSKNYRVFSFAGCKDKPVRKYEPNFFASFF